jgi:acetolactate synthase-1/2/3 large subunit
MVVRKRAPSASAKEHAAPKDLASDALAAMFAALGVELAFGVVGGAVAPFCEALDSRSPIRVVHYRHEAGAAFAAVEASLATDKPVLVFATTGPGMMNALTGIMAARWDGAKVILVTGATPPQRRGRGALQETTGNYSTPTSAAFTSGAIFHQSMTIESLEELEVVAARFAAGLAKPSGFVGHLSLPIALQTMECEPLPPPRVTSLGPPACGRDVARECAQMLSGTRFVLWVGFGARKARGLVRELAERTGAPVLCSPRAKGVLPASHPLFMGSTGLGTNHDAELYMRENRPEYVVVLGSRLAEGTSCWMPEYTPTRGFVHVDLDPDSMGAAFPDVVTHAVQAEVSSFLQELLAAWPKGAAGSTSRRPTRPARLQLTARKTGLVRPQYLMQRVQAHIVEGSDAIVMAEGGNSFVWANQQLHFEDCRYRISPHWASMGHTVTAVVGAALARGGKAVALAGDGAMLMLNEINTAVQYGAPAVWIVLNDARYGMIDQGMRTQGFAPVEVHMPRVDFAHFARSMGADGVRVAQEHELDAAIHAAMQAPGPFVIDVQIDPTEHAPISGRIRSLIQQGAHS